VTVRAAKPADLSRIGEIRHVVMENALSGASKASDAEVASWYMDQAIFLVSETDGEIAGFTCANHQTGHVWALFVDPVLEGRGHGRALLDAALADLVRFGRRQSSLTTGAGTRAERFYRRHGWQTMDRTLDGQVAFTKALDPE
jgi:GNAT superfamily N-acetyltransferase